MMIKFCLKERENFPGFRGLILLTSRITGFWPFQSKKKEQIVHKRAISFV